MAGLKHDLEENMLKILQKNFQNCIPTIPAPKNSPKNQTLLPSTIRQELKGVMKEVLLENSIVCKNTEETNEKAQTSLIKKCLVSIFFLRFFIAYSFETCMLINVFL